MFLDVKQEISTYLSTRILNEKESNVRRQRLKTCIDSLNRFPLPISSVDQTGLLRGFNTELVNELKEHIEKRYDEERTKKTQRSPVKTKRSESLDQCLDFISPIAVKCRKTQNVVIDRNPTLQTIETVDDNVQVLNESERDSKVTNESSGDFELAKQLEEEERLQIEERERLDYEMALKLSQTYEAQDNEVETSVISECKSELQNNNVLVNDDLCFMNKNTMNFEKKKSKNVFANVDEKLLENSILNIINSEPVLDRDTKIVELEPETSSMVGIGMKTNEKNVEILLLDENDVSANDEIKNVHVISEDSNDEEEEDAFKLVKLRPVKKADNLTKSKGLFPFDTVISKPSVRSVMKPEKTTKRSDGIGNNFVDIDSGKRINKDVEKKKRTHTEKIVPSPQNFIVCEHDLESAREIPDWISNRLSVDDLLLEDDSRSVSDDCSSSSSQEITYDDDDVEISDPTFQMRWSEYDILLIVDNAEIYGSASGGKKNAKDITLETLNASGINFEIRHLSVGDFTWIARHKNYKEVLNRPLKNNKKMTAKESKERVTEVERENELVLPYIVERKRLDDLKQSIVDGRYKEQKQRLLDSNIKHKWYLVEDYNKHMQYWTSQREIISSSSSSCGNKPNGGDGGPKSLINKNGYKSKFVGMSRNGSGVKSKTNFNGQALESAVASTAASGFKMKFTSSQEASLQFLIQMTKHIVEVFESNRFTLTNSSKKGVGSFGVGAIIHSCPSFHALNTDSRKSKPLSTSQIFRRMLVQQYGLSGRVAHAITSAFPTPAHLIEGFQRHGSACLTNNVGGEVKIRNDVARILYMLYYNWMDEEFI